MKLDPDDIEAIAARVAELVRSEAQPAGLRYVDAATVARILQVDRDWVYAHARSLGAVRLGGPRGRLRFDLRAIDRELGEQRAWRSEARAAPNKRQLAPAAQRVDLLPYER